MSKRLRCVIISEIASLAREMDFLALAQLFSMAQRVKRTLCCQVAKLSVVKRFYPVCFKMEWYIFQALCAMMRASLKQKVSLLVWT